jgi:hypothetical protein
MSTTGDIFDPLKIGARSHRCHTGKSHTIKDAFGFTFTCQADNEEKAARPIISVAYRAV